jgi:peptidoglycan hydrolase-like protein with peptidoglycan-binding domain
MNWVLVFLAWMLGHASRDLTTWAEPRTAPDRPPPRRGPRPSTTRPTTSSPTPAPRPTPAPGTVPASTTAPPWPQAVPASLPPWPAGWEPDEPVGAGVAARAAALLPELWRYGENTRKTEQTSGRWITYVARSMGSKRGVVAFRPKAGAMPTASSTTATSAYVPASTGPSLMPGSRTLRRGDTGTDVFYLQGRLGVAVDGKFGPATEAAVRTYQGQHGLSPDGVVGPRTWGSLLAVAA